MGAWWGEDLAVKPTRNLQVDVGLLWFHPSCLGADAAEPLAALKNQKPYMFGVFNLRVYLYQHQFFPSTCPKGAASLFKSGFVQRMFSFQIHFQKKTNF